MDLQLMESSVLRAAADGLSMSIFPRRYYTEGLVDKAAMDSTAVRAKRLGAQIDTLIRFAPTCEARAATQPDSTSARLLAQLRAYESALRDFRAAIGLPNK